MLQTQILLAVGVKKSVFKHFKLKYCCSFKNFLKEPPGSYGELRISRIF